MCCRCNVQFENEMFEKVFAETQVELKVGTRLLADSDTVLNYLVLAPSRENDQVTIRWDGSVKISPRMTISSDQSASFNLSELYGDQEMPDNLRDLSIVFRSAYLRLDKDVVRQHLDRDLSGSLELVRGIFERITSHRSSKLSFENNALIVAPNEFVWPVSVLKYVSEVVGDDFKTMRRFGLQ